MLGPSISRIAQPTDVQPARMDDRYVPVRVGDLIAAVSGASADRNGEREAVGAVAEAIRDVVEQEAAAFERELMECYAPFDPDCDLVLPADLDKSDAAYAAMERRVAYLLEKANFRRLSDVQIDEAVRAANSHGLRVRLNPDQVRALQVWVRGRGTCERVTRHWRRFWKPETSAVEVMRRVAVVARLRDEPHLIVKVFKDIPLSDLEALLPHAEVTMTWLDRLMLLGGSAGTIGSTGWKLLNLAVLAVTKLLWILVVGLVTICVRVVTGYQRARKSRISQRTQHLYYKNLGSNAAALHKLVALIAQEEAKEAILAYAVCLDGPLAEPGPAAVRSAAERLLAERFQVCVCFDVEDAEETLDRLDLWADRAARRVASPAEALLRLRAHWTQRRTLSYHAGRLLIESNHGA